MLQVMKRHPFRFRICLFGIALSLTAFYLLFREPVSKVSPDFSEYPVRGIDISAHNRVTDWNLVADSVDFVIIKATEGGNWNDREFQNNYRQARNAGLKVGAYHFFRFDREALPQSINFYNALWNKHLDFPAVIDVEEDGNPDGIDYRTIVARLSSMVSFLESRGVEVMFYANKKSYAKYVRPNFPEHPVWLCSLSAEPEEGLGWTIWQFSHSGEIPGIEGKVDLNVLRNGFDKETP